MKKTVYLAGGDLRQITLAKLLEEEGFDVHTLALSEGEQTYDGLEKADILILPVPVSTDNIYINAPISKKRIAISEIFQKIPANCYVLGACISPEIEEKLKERGLKYTDYFKREELIVKNAIPTAEGAIEIALSEMPITLFASRVLVTGYGRVGKVLASRLYALGAKVTVSARKHSDFAWIAERGYDMIHTNDLIQSVGEYDLIVNTVPTEVLTEEVLKNVREDTLIIDLASKPGGVDLGAAKRLCRNVIWALSLPGKTAPITSGRIIKEAIMNILAETGV